MAINLVTTRFERLERAQRETNHRLEKVGDTMSRVADFLEAHSAHFERMEDVLIGMSERIDRLTTAIVRGRTQDLVRFEDHERRIRAVERKKRR